MDINRQILTHTHNNFMGLTLFYTSLQTDRKNELQTVSSVT